MIGQTVAPQCLSDDPLVVADQHVAEAEQRCDRQVRVISALAEGTQARAYAEHVLRVMERNLAFSRAHQSLIGHLLTPV